MLREDEGIIKMTDISYDKTKEFNVAVDYSGSAGGRDGLELFKKILHLNYPLAKVSANSSHDSEDTIVKIKEETIWNTQKDGAINEDNTPDLIVRIRKTVQG